MRNFKQKLSLATAIIFLSTSSAYADALVNDNVNKTSDDNLFYRAAEQGDLSNDINIKEKKTNALEHSDIKMKSLQQKVKEGKKLTPKGMTRDVEILRD